MSGLLDMLFGRKATPNQIPMGSPLQPPMPQQAPVAQAPAPQPQAGSLVQQMAQASPAAPSNQAPPQAAPQDPNTPIDVVGHDLDTWKPHKAGFLGQVADYILGTHIGRGVERKNMEEALQHITSNPMEAIRRMAQVNPEAATALWDKVKDNMRADGAQERLNRVNDLTVDKYLDTDTANAMYYASKSGNPEIYKAARDRAIAHGQRFGKDYSDIPEDFNPSYAEAYGAGVIPAAKQMSVASQDANHKLQHEDRQAATTERANYHAGQLGLGAQRVGIAKTNSGIAQQNANTAAQKAALWAQQNQGGAVQVAPDGSALVPDKTGKTAVRFMKDGRKALYIRGPDGHHWRFSHQMIGRDEKATGVVSAPEVDIPDDNPAG